MANTKPENRFIQRVHKRIPQVYSEKTNNPFRGGTPDVFYTGTSGDLWVEYKYLPKVPKSANVRAALSELQRLWLHRRYAEGRNVAVIIGCPEGGVILEAGMWELSLPPAEFKRRLLSVDGVADWILYSVGPSVWHLPKNFSNSPK